MTGIAKLSIIALLLASTACTQQPAQIELKGQNTYNRDGSSTYASNNSYSGPISSRAASPQAYVTPEASPIATVHADSNTVPNASVGSIGVTDLAPITASKAAPAATATTAQSAATTATPFRPATLAPAAGPTTKPAAAAVKSTTTNPWTNKPRDVAAQGEDDQSFNIRPQATSAPKEQLVSEVKKPSSDKAVSQLDSIIGNEGGASKVDAAITKPVAKTESSGFMWPVNSKKIISAYGPKGKGKANDGINIASANGEPVWAAADGEVVYVGNELQGYGNMVLIKHSGDKSTSYAHLSKAAVDKYDRVKQGDIIGYVGNSGNVKDAQLHFAIRDGKDPVDPIKFMKSNVASN